MMTQAVGYVSGRAEVLCTAFFLAAFLAALSWQARGRPGWLLACALAWAMSLASKEVAIAFPLALAAYGVFVWPGSSAAARRRLAWAVAGMLVVMAVAATYRLVTLVQVENVARARFVWTNVLVGLDTFRQYATLMIVPAGQSIFHTTRVASVTSPAIILLNLATLGGVCAVAWRARRQEPAAAFGLAWFFLLLMPSTLLLAFDIGEPMAEQRVYLAAGGLAMAAGAGYARAAAWFTGHVRQPAIVAGTLLAGCLALLGYLTMERNRLWHDPVALWSEAVSREPEAWVAYRGLGDALRERGDYPNAAEAYGEAVRLAPKEAGTYLPLATSLLMAGRLDEADGHFEQAERLSPGSVEAQTGRALVARMSGRRDEARTRLEAIARAHADAVLPRRLLAELYEQDYGDRAAAWRACLEVRVLAPGTPGVDDCVRRNQPPAEGSR
jgi:tetratricopeptide (TPR) repeat protein